MRKYAIAKILDHLSEHGTSSAMDIYEAIGESDISTSTFYRAIRWLRIRSIILTRHYESESGRRWTEYRINFYMLSDDLLPNQ